MELIKLRPYKECNYEERHGAGIYLMIPPSGMKYIGRSKHLLKRLNGHIYSFYKPRENDWHREGVKEFAPAAIKRYSWINGNLLVVNRGYKPGDEELETYQAKAV